jgi:hypothetical protein
MNLINLFKKIRPYVYPYRWLVIITLILTLIGSLMAQVNAVVLDRTIDAINALVNPEGFAWSKAARILTAISIILLGKEILTAADDYNAFYIFSHLFHHFLINGLGARQLCDWMLFLRARSSYIDKEGLKAVLERLDMLMPWQAFGCVLVKYFGMPAADFPFYDPSQERIAEKIVMRILAEGNFGKERDVYKKRGKNYFLNKAWAMLAHIGRSFGLLFLFPRHSFRQIWHTISNGFAKVWNDVRIRSGF